jgi:hypothetical protein
MALVQYQGRPEAKTARVFLTGTNTVAEGAPVYYTSAASPVDTTAFESGDAATTTPVGGAVESSPTTHIPPKFAGVVAAESAGTVAPNYITIHRPAAGDVVTIQVATGIDVGDGAVLADATDIMADGGAHAIASDEFYCLYDEDNVNNPHGVDAISASAGLVEAVYTGVNRSS